MIDTIELVIHDVLHKKLDVLTEIALDNTRNKSLFESENQIDLNTIDYNEYINPGNMELYCNLLELSKKVTSIDYRMTNNVQVITSEISDVVDVTTSKMRVIDQNVNLIKYMEGTKVREYYHSISGQYRIASSMPHIAYTLKPQKNTIEFNFSIPKYLYGHSLAEFIPQRGSDNYYKYASGIISSLDCQNEILYDRLMNFIDKFLTRLESDFRLTNKLNRGRIEIKRLDMCYNQYFESKEQALQYLNYQKRIEKKGMQRNSNKIIYYDTSFFYQSVNSTSFKVYHKGTEYAQNNLEQQKHKEINKNAMQRYYAKHEDKPKFKKYYRRFLVLHAKSMESPLTPEDFKNRKTNLPDEDFYKFYKKTLKILPIDMAFLKNEMDKILRYEITMRPEFFAYHYKRYEYRKDSKLHKIYVDNYKRVHSADMNNKTEEISKKDRQNYNEMKKFYDRSITLMYQSNEKMNFVNNHGDALDKDMIYVPKMYSFPDGNLHRSECVGLSREMLKKYFENFKQNILYFQVHAFDNDTKFLALAEEYNNSVPQRIKDYNQVHASDVYFHNIKYPNKQVKNAVDILTNTQKIDNKLQTFYLGSLERILRSMDEGLTLDEVIKKYDINRKNKSRTKKILKVMGIDQTSIKTETRINTEVNFIKYYLNTEDPEYQRKFYLKSNHLKHN